MNLDQTYVPTIRRAPPSHGGGQRFESASVHKRLDPTFGWSAPVPQPASFKPVGSTLHFALLTFSFRAAAARRSASVIGARITACSVEPGQTPAPRISGGWSWLAIPFLFTRRPDTLAIVDAEGALLRPCRRIGVLEQSVNGSRVLLDPASGLYYSLNDVGGRIWELCDGSRLISEVVAAIQEEYDAPRETVEADVLALLAELVDEKLVAEGA